MWSILKEDGPDIVYKKDIHNTVANAISWLNFDPILNEQENWMMFTKCWWYYTKQQESVENNSAHQDQMSLVFANHSDEEVMYPLTVRKVAQAQKLDASLKKQKDMYSSTWVENT